MSKSNFIETKKAIDDITSAIDKQISSANELNSKVVQLNSNYAKLPSEYTKSLNDIATANKKVVDSEAGVAKAIKDKMKALENETKARQSLDAQRQKALALYEKEEALIIKEANKKIAESEKIIAQKEKEFSKFEQQFNKYEANLAKQAIAEEKAKRATVQSILDQSKAIQSLDAQRQKALALNEKEAQKLAYSEQLYNKVQAKLTQLSNEYKNLAIQKELTGKLTDKESQRYDFLQGKITKYDTTLKAVDATMGKYQRNVGNYASGFSPLNNSINQLTREMPAFANSVQTGFMAISNNLPIFFDAIGGIKKANADLRAEGKPTQSVLSQLASGLFSWGTALSVAVTLLTIYGKDIVDYVTGLTEAEKAQKKLTESLREIEAIHTSQIVTLQALKNIVIDTSNSENERLKAYDKLKETMPELTKMTMEQAVSTGFLNEITKKYVNTLLLQAEVEKLASIIADEQTQLDIQKTKTLEEQVKWYDRIVSYITKGNFGTSITTTRIKEETSARQKSIETYKKLLEEKLAELNINEAELRGFDKKHKKVKEAIKQAHDLKEASSLGKPDLTDMDSSIRFVEKEISRYEGLRDVLSKTSKEYQDMDKIVNVLKQSLDLLKDPSKYITADVSGLKAQQELIKAHELGWKESLKAQNAYAAGFTQNFIDNAGFKTTFDILNGQILGFGSNAKVTAIAIMESFQEMFNFINQASQANFDAEYKRLEDQKNTSIAFAGEDEAAKKEIEKQTEARKKQIARREAKAKKDTAIFNIITDTAQAIIGLWANPGYPAAIPLTALVGVLGAAQIAMVNSQPLPQYFKGTDNAPSGLAWTNEKGAEIHTDKHGNIKDLGTKKGAQLTMMDQGDKVFTASESQRMLQDMELNNLLSSNGIIMNNNIQGISDAQVDKIVSAVNNAPTSEIIMDELGFRKLQRRNGIKEQVLNSRFRTKITPR